MDACLVEEPRWAHVLEGIQTLCPNFTNPDCHRLDTGDFFMQGVSKEEWRRIHGKTQHIPEGGVITWRRPRAIDGALMPHKTIRRMEARGVPFGFCTRRHLQKLIRPIGVLHEVVCDDILAGDPNCMGLEVELENDKDIPDKLSLVMAPCYYAPETATDRGSINRGRRCTYPHVRCITWNVRGLRDPRRRGVVGRYLREWGADIRCLQEAMLANTEQHTWSDLGWGGNETHVSIKASGRLGCILLAWKTSLFDREEISKGKHVVAARLSTRWMAVT